MSVREHLIERAHRLGWEQIPGDDVVLFRYIDHGRREFLELRFKREGTKLTAVLWRHPRYAEPRRITRRKVDHVHALLRARATWPVS